MYVSWGGLRFGKEAENRNECQFQLVELKELRKYEFGEVLSYEKVAIYFSSIWLYSSVIWM